MFNAPLSDFVTAELVFVFDAGSNGSRSVAGNANVDQDFAVDTYPQLELAESKLDFKLRHQ